MRKCGNCKKRMFRGWAGIDFCIGYELACNEEEEIKEASRCNGYEEGNPDCMNEEMYSSSTGGDYSPSNPWDAPGMSVRDFI